MVSLRGLTLFAIHYFILIVLLILFLLSPSFPFPFFLSAFLLAFLIVDYSISLLPVTRWLQSLQGSQGVAVVGGGGGEGGGVVG